MGKECDFHLPQSSSYLGVQMIDLEQVPETYQENTPVSYTHLTLPTN
ncbi:hypothetical protein H8933_18700 [Bacillus pumilus]|nr:hypothetical protein [Bacillus pumilus]MBC5901972.1 hypothetical protein [Bacillus pumilus]